MKCTFQFHKLKKLETSTNIIVVTVKEPLQERSSGDPQAPISKCEASTGCLRPITCGCYRRARSGGRRWQLACGQTTAVSSSPRQRQGGCRPVGRHQQLLLVCSTVTVKHSCLPPTQHPTPNTNTPTLAPQCMCSWHWQWNRQLRVMSKKYSFKAQAEEHKTSVVAGVAWCEWRGRKGCLSLAWVKPYQTMTTKTDLHNPTSASHTEHETYETCATYWLRQDTEEWWRMWTHEGWCGAGGRSAREARRGPLSPAQAMLAGGGMTDLGTLSSGKCRENITDFKWTFQ